MVAACIKCNHTGQQPSCIHDVVRGILTTAIDAAVLQYEQPTSASYSLLSSRRQERWHGRLSKRVVTPCCEGSRFIYGQYVLVPARHLHHLANDRRLHECEVVLEIST